LTYHAVSVGVTYAQMPGTWTLLADPPTRSSRTHGTLLPGETL
jgi:hypothetical protein